MSSLKTRISAGLCALLMTLTLLPAASAVEEYSHSGASGMEKLSRQEIAQLLDADKSETEFFAVQPSVSAPYVAGSLTDEILQRGLDRLNAVRRLAGLPGVSLDSSLNETAQHGAVVLAALDTMTHNPSKPAGMEDSFYQKGYEATSSSNLSYFSWADTDPLGMSVDMFMDDSDAGNVSRVGHRRWQLNPELGKVGFGYARSDSGMGYVGEYVFDRSGAGCDYEFVAWPASGNFPNDIFPSTSAWSITLNPEEYRAPSLDGVTVTLTRDSDGAVWSFRGGLDGTPSNTGKYFNVDNVGYGVDNCIIFRPDGVDSYDGVYTVTVDGLTTASGAPARLSYQVDFFQAEGYTDGQQQEQPPVETEQPSTPDSFPDVQVGDWYYDTVMNMVQLGAINGFPDGTFGPEKPITLAELCKIALGVLPGPTPEESYTATVLAKAKEILEAENPGYWANDIILTCTMTRGLEDLEDSQQTWAQPLTRLELTRVISGIYLTSDAFPTSGDPATAGSWVADYIGDYDSAGIRGNELEACVLWAYELGLVGGVNANGDFNPQGTVSRAEACTILSRILYPETRLSLEEKPVQQTQDTTSGGLTRLADGTDVAGNTRIHYAQDVAYDYCRALEQEIGIPIFYLPEFTEKQAGLLWYSDFDSFPVDKTYFQLVLEQLKVMKSAYDLYPDGFLKEMISKKNPSRSTEIILCPYTYEGVSCYGAHVYDESDDAVKVDQIYYTGMGDARYYSHEMGHMVMSCAAILGGWSTVTGAWENMNASAGANDYVSFYAMMSRPEDWAETWAALWHETDTVAGQIAAGGTVLGQKVRYMTQLLSQNYSSFSTASLPWSYLL